MPELIRLYPDENDWYNGDESSLFFRALPDRGYVVGKRKAVGGKKAKDRLSVHLTMNMTGTYKVKPLLIASLGSYVVRERLLGASKLYHYTN